MAEENRKPDFSKRFLSRLVKRKTFPEAQKTISEYVSRMGATVAPDIVDSFLKRRRLKWKKAHYTESTMETKFKNWLDEDLEVVLRPATHKNISRDLKNFDDLSDSQKRRRTSDLRQEESAALLFATSSTLRKEGQADAAKVVQQCVESPARSRKMLQGPELIHSQYQIFTPDEALGLLVKLGLSKQGYRDLRRSVTAKGLPDLFPSYEKVVAAKTNAYPTDIKSSELEAKVPLQNLLDHTVSRLSAVVDEEKLKELDEEESVTLISKWGMDGSSGHGELKQIFESVLRGSDSHVFTTTMVPVILLCGSITVWENKTPSSTWLCRSLRLAFEKESVDSIKSEFNRVNNEIQTLRPSKIRINDKDFFVMHKLLLTMIDGKVVNALIGNRSTLKCPVCVAGPSEMNVKLPIVNTEVLNYGISPLHARIKMMEFLLKLAYSEPGMKKGTRKSEEQKAAIVCRKRVIQERFRNEMGLKIDVPKPGFGTSNDGNTARRFFSDSNTSSNILGVDERIIRRFGNIMRYICSHRKVDPIIFERYATNTLNIFVQLYPHYGLSPTVHKILHHGADFMRYSILPLGILSEEAQEGRNKDFKLYKRDYARRSSRKLNLLDVFQRFFVTSDPVIRSFFPPMIRRKLIADEEEEINIPDSYESMAKSSSERAESDSEESLDSEESCEGSDECPDSDVETASE